MIAGFRNADLEKIRVAEHSGCRSKATTRMSPDADMRCIHVPVFRSKLPDTSDLIRQRILTHIRIIHVMKTFVAVGIAGAFDHYNDKSQFSQRLMVTSRCTE